MKRLLKTVNGYSPDFSSEAKVKQIEQQIIHGKITNIPTTVK